MMTGWVWRGGGFRTSTWTVLTSTVFLTPHAADPWTTLIMTTRTVVVMIIVMVRDGGGESDHDGDGSLRV